MPEVGAESIADESRCTCGNSGNPTVIDAWYPSHRPGCGAWCTCRKRGVPITDNAHTTDCGIFQDME